MAHPDQSDFLANRIRYVQNQPHLQQPPAPETSPGPRITRATRFTGPPKLTRPSSCLSTNMERERIHQTHSSAGQRGSILAPSRSVDGRCRMSSSLDTWNPETPLSSDSSWFFRFPLVQQAPESPGRPGLPGHPSSPGPAATCLPTWRGRRFTRPTVSPGPRTTRPPRFTIPQQSRKRMQVKWDDGSLQCLYTSSCWVQIRKTDERTFSL